MSVPILRGSTKSTQNSPTSSILQRPLIDRLQPRVAAQHLRRLAEGSQEGAAHVVAVAEAGLASDDFDGMTALLHQVSRRLDPQIFDRLGRRLTCLRVERPAELAWAEVSCVGELRHRQGLVQ